MTRSNLITLLSTVVVLLAAPGVAQAAETAQPAHCDNVCVRECDVVTNPDLVCYGLGCYPLGECTGGTGGCGWDLDDADEWLECYIDL